MPNFNLIFKYKVVYKIKCPLIKGGIWYMMLKGNYPTAIRLNAVTVKPPSTEFR